MDYAILMDATGSMDSVMSSTKRYIVESTSRMKIKSQAQTEFHVAVEYFRDPVNGDECPPEFEQFTLDVTNIERFLSDKTAIGGGDEAEDWHGTFKVALHILGWRPNSQKILVLIADACRHELGSLHDLHETTERPKVLRAIKAIAKQHNRMAILKIQDERYGTLSTYQHLSDAADEVKRIYEEAGGEYSVIDSLRINSANVAACNMEEVISKQLETTSIRLFKNKPLLPPPPPSPPTLPVVHTSIQSLLSTSTSPSSSQTSTQPVTPPAPKTYISVKYLRKNFERK